jgi:hypothetical protein
MVILYVPFFGYNEYGSIVFSVNLVESETSNTVRHKWASRPARSLPKWLQRIKNLMTSTSSTESRIVKRMEYNIVNVISVYKL